MKKRRRFCKNLDCRFGGDTAFRVTSIADVLPVKQSNQLFFVSGNSSSETFQPIIRLRGNFIGSVVAIDDLPRVKEILFLVIDKLV